MHPSTALTPFQEDTMDERDERQESEKERRERILGFCFIVVVFAAFGVGVYLKIYQHS